jgi:hypothetical protein
MIVRQMINRDGKSTYRDKERKCAGEIEMDQDMWEEIKRETEREITRQGEIELQFS